MTNHKSYEVTIVTDKGTVVIALSAANGNAARRQAMNKIPLDREIVSAKSKAVDASEDADDNATQRDRQFRER